MRKNYFCFGGSFLVAYEGGWHFAGDYEVVCRGGRFIVREVFGNGRHRYLKELSNVRSLENAQEFVDCETRERMFEC